MIQLVADQLAAALAHFWMIGWPCTIDVAGHW
jgi:hypothetical protein